ncbi:MAG: carbohydrate ABC transporter permease, partial [bacterium]
FRILFFIPLMITPVGIAYQWRMLADMNKGPFSELWNWVGLGEFAWGSDPWAARTMVMLADAWMWIPFMFIVMLSAIETVSDDLIEAAEVDGASKWMVFTDVIWPQIAPVAGTVILIRWIEGFKLIDIPNVLTHGGPGIATETMTMHSWSLWKALDFSGSSAVAYTLLFVSVVICVSFFNFVIRRFQAPV